MASAWTRHPIQFEHSVTGS